MSRAQLEELRAWRELGPWRGKVSINRLHGQTLGRLTALPYESLFQVVAEWTGPPAAWSANRDTAATVQAQDTVIVSTYEYARRIALEASDHLRAAQVPDLRKLAGAGSVSIARAFG